MAYVLGLDASTQSFSALVIDLEGGRIVAEHAVNFGRDLPGYGAPQGFIPGGAGGEVHADPLMWLDALDLLLEEMQARGVDFSQVRAVSGAGQQHGTVYLNSTWLRRVGELDPRYELSDQLRDCLARPTSPIWMDTSTTAECADIASAVGGQAAVCERSGSQTVERFSGPQIRRFALQDAAGYAATARIHLVSSFFASVLAGRDAPIDHGDGAGMNLMNLGTLAWDDCLLAATAPDLRAKLPPLVPSATVVGRIHPYFSRYGFPEDALVVAFTGDNNSSLVGMGAHQPGKVVISLGTSDTFFAAMPEVRTDPRGFGHVFGNPCGGFMTLQCFRNGSLAREKIKEAHGLSWEEFDCKAFVETPPGNNGNLMVPFFGAEITPRVDCPQPVYHGSESFVAKREPLAAARACVEGQLLNMWYHAQWMGLRPDELLLTGGASRSSGIAQTAADVFQAKVNRLDVSGSVALGGALRAAATALGADLATLQAVFSAPVAGATVEPRPACAAVYAEAASRLLELIGQLPVRA